jgi:hypothetical protein
MGNPTDTQGRSDSHSNHPKQGTSGQFERGHEHYQRSAFPWGIVTAGVGNCVTLIMQIVGNCLTADRTVRPGGIRLTWAEDTGWSYAFLGVRGRLLPRGPVVPLRRVFATPDAVAEAADTLVRTRHRPSGEHGGEWEQAQAVREAIKAFRAQA